MNGILAVAKKLSPIVLIAGAGLMVFAFLMPWWGITITKPEKLEEPKVTEPDYRDKKEKYDKEKKAHDKRMKANERIRKQNRRWYEATKVDDHLEDKWTDADDETTSITVRLWGWNTGTGITAFILGLVILPLGIVPLFVAPYRRWSWIGSFVASIMGLIMFVFGIVFYFGSPGKNTDDIAQGVGLSPGPFLEILGSLAVLASGVFGGVIGVMEFIESLKSDSRPRRRRRPELVEPEFDDDDAAAPASEFDDMEGAETESDGAGDGESGRDDPKLDEI